MRLGAEFFRVPPRMYFDVEDTDASKAEREAAEASKADPDLEGLGDKGKATLERIRGERDAEKQRAKTLQDERDALKKKVDAAEKREADEQEEAAKKKGEFEQLAEKRGTELATAKQTIEELTAQVERMRAAIDASIEADWKALPKEVADLFSGAEDDTIAKMEWLPKAKAAAGLDKERRQGHELDPDPSKRDRQPLDAEIEAQRARTGFIPY